MTNLAFEYSSADNAWVSSSFTMTGNTVLKIKLKQRGKVVIKKLDEGGVRYPKIHISKDAEQFLYTITGDVVQKTLKVYTSSQPSSITVE